MFYQGSPSTYWIDVTNISLGIVALSFLIYLAPALMRDLLELVWRRVIRPK